MTKRVTIRKEGSHYVVSVGGVGMSLAFSKKEADKLQKKYRDQIKRTAKKLKK